MLHSTLHPEPTTAQCQPQGRLAFGLTPRTLYLLAAGFLWLIPGYYIPSLAWIMLVWDALILIASLFDGLRLPSPATIAATRSWLS
jgi:hypothetical protein